MFEWLFGHKENWRLVKTITESVVQTGGYTQKDGKVYYHLFESSKGRRKVEYQSTLKSSDLEADAKRIDTYQEKIYPWLNGRVDPDIPRYSQIPEEETAVMLRGKKI
jgi:hypothetical protein